MKLADYDTLKKRFGNDRAQQLASNLAQKGHNIQGFNNKQIGRAPQPTAQPTVQPTPQPAQNVLVQNTREFSYNPQNDPAYQSAVNRVRRNVADEQANTTARLMATGQGNSSYSETLARQLANRGESEIANDITPYYTNLAYNRWNDNRLFGLQQDQFELDRLNADRQFSLQEGQLTGRYMPMGAQTIINSILDLKEQAETPGISQERLRELSSQADVLRKQLSAMGVDPNFIGANVNRETAMQNRFNAGIPTLQKQQFDRDVFTSDRDFNYQQEQDELAQRNLEFEKAYRAQRDSEEDRRWWADFEQRGKQFAQQMGYNWAQLSQRQKEAAMDEAYRRDRLVLEQNQIGQQQRINMDDEKQGLVSAVRSGQISPGAALQQINQDEQLGFYTTDEAEELRRFLSTVTKATPQLPSPIVETDAFEDYMANLPKDNSLRQEARQKNYPTLDYLSYMKDPKGNFSGITFEEWRRLYGPRLEPAR